MVLIRQLTDDDDVVLREYRICQNHGTCFVLGVQYILVYTVYTYETALAGFLSTTDHDRLIRLQETNTRKIQQIVWARSQCRAIRKTSCIDPTSESLFFQQNDPRRACKTSLGLAPLTNRQNNNYLFRRKSDLKPRSRIIYEVRQIVNSTPTSKVDPTSIPRTPRVFFKKKKSRGHHNIRLALDTNSEPNGPETENVSYHIKISLNTTTATISTIIPLLS